MIIDSHTHTFPKKIAEKAIPKMEAMAHSRSYTKGTDGALLSSMKESNIDISILLPVATNTAQVEKLNNIAIEKNMLFSRSGLYSLGAMHPDYKNFREELKRLKNNGITGIKLHPAYQNSDLDDTRFLNIIYEASALNLAVVIHAGLDIGIMHHNFSSVKMINNVMEIITPTKFVLAHLGGWKGWNEVEKELAGMPLYMDTAFVLGSYEPYEDMNIPKEKTRMLSKEQFKRIVEKHGYNKILFGTDSPWSDQKKTIEKVKACSLDESKLDLIFYKNAKKVFNI